MQVRDCLDAGPGEVEVPELSCGDDAKVGAAFGGDIYMAVAGERGGGDVEEGLGEDPGDEGLGDCFVEGAHRGVDRSVCF